MPDVVIPMKINAAGNVIRSRRMVLGEPLTFQRGKTPIMTIKASSHGQDKSQGKAKFFASQGEKTWFLALQRGEMEKTYYISPNLDMLVNIALYQLGIRCMTAGVVGSKPWSGSTETCVDDGTTPTTFTTTTTTFADRADAQNGSVQQMGG